MTDSDREGPVPEFVRCIVRCVACHAERELKAGEVSAVDVPMCERCFSPMVAKEARRG